MPQLDQISWVKHNYYLERSTPRKYSRFGELPYRSTRKELLSFPSPVPLRGGRLTDDDATVQFTQQALSGGAPLIAVVQPTDFRDGNDASDFLPLYGPRLRRILRQGEVSARCMVVSDCTAKSR